MDQMLDYDDLKILDQICQQDVCLCVYEHDNFKIMLERWNVV